MSDFDRFPDRLREAQLPAGERIVWQGGPHWRKVLRHLFHGRLVASWFAAFCVWRFAAGLNDTGSWLYAVARVIDVALPAIATFAILAGLAALVARSTSYTITNRRVVLRFGVALPALVNLPLGDIESASVAKRRDGSGDIALEMPANRVLAYWKLWPNVRPWHFLRARPALRNLADADEAAAALKAATFATAHKPARAGESVGNHTPADAAAVAA